MTTEIMNKTEITSKTDHDKIKDKLSKVFCDYQFQILEPLVELVCKDLPRYAKEKRVGQLSGSDYYNKARPHLEMSINNLNKVFNKLRVLIKNVDKGIR